MAKIPSDYSDDEWKAAKPETRARAWDAWADVLQRSIPRITGPGGGLKLAAVKEWIREAQRAAREERAKLAPPKTTTKKR